ncbi:hypothetical protein Emtol_2987 [Emticicia oligotrophica DSM 17448]|uniref:Uncharacterized protein n=1 Tax=Emticicia oligotrophica (strain DSM 17448 / CIP 109782 / MTCC 6937 / GPTSA100-15) TaxID=929562 RepID=A0ABM5N3W4_EMTOG|nr:hypothetical protein [Emticicia oligotrophica]AFK04120.1 hypothetical protein Emtol_2987 [Emticicia oligotrophica DSM 17448]
MGKLIEYSTEEEFKEAFKDLKKKWEEMKSTQAEIIGKAEIEQKIKHIARILRKKEISDIDWIIADNLINELSLITLKKGFDIDYILSFCPASDKIKTFSKYADKLSDKEYWSYLNECYTMQDYSTAPYALTVNLFKSDRKEKEFLMSDSEREFIKSLPDEVTIYRGMSKDEYKSKKYRFSWTLDKSIAEMFAKRNSLLYKTEFVVCKLIIPKDKIVAYFVEREEKEVIYLG